MMIRAFALLPVLTFFAACGKNSDPVPPDPVIAGVETVLNTLAMTSDDLTPGTSFAREGENGAACTTRASEGFCDPSSGVRSIRYGGCRFGENGSLLEGIITLRFSDRENCRLDHAGDQVESIIPEMTLRGANDRSIITSTEVHNAYESTWLGGPMILTVVKPGARWRLDVPGLNRRILTEDGTDLVNITAYTPESALLSGGLARDERHASARLMRTEHHVVERTLSYEVSDLAWSSRECCFPTSGTMTVTGEHGSERIARVEFTGQCGEALFTRPRGEQIVTFQDCR